MALTPRFYNDKEAGEVQILESENFSAWKDDVTIALGMIRGWDLVMGRSPEPANHTTTAHKEWVKLRTKALKLLSSSIITIYKPKILPFA